ncbi:RSP_7527 family protein [Kiloniella majae]|uniref:RSP_7527 family protein n=1 Tax=Kiloniella majae TaxID=1938558 RepID=UPI000A277726|nr:hypothetical protein [Kiloniella majae]
MKPIVTAKDFDFTAADIDFHVREAHRLRSEAAGRLFAAAFKTLFKSTKNFLSSMSYHKVKHA